MGRGSCHDGTPWPPCVFGLDQPRGTIDKVGDAYRPVSSSVLGWAPRRMRDLGPMRPAGTPVAVGYSEQTLKSSSLLLHFIDWAPSAQKSTVLVVSGFGGHLKKGAGTVLTGGP